MTPICCKGACASPAGESGMFCPYHEKYFDAALLMSKSMDRCYCGEPPDPSIPGPPICAEHNAAVDKMTRPRSLMIQFIMEKSHVSQTDADLLMRKIFALCDHSSSSRCAYVYPDLTKIVCIHHGATVAG